MNEEEIKKTDLVLLESDDDFDEEEEFDEEKPHVYEPKFLEYEPSPEEKEKFWFSKYRQNPDFVREINGTKYIVDKNERIMYYYDGRAYNEGGAHQCITTNRTTGYRCCRRMVTGTTVCNRHGAGSPNKGRPGIILQPKSPMTLLQAAMPDKLRSRVISAVTDPKLHDLSESIALLDARLSELLESLPDEDELSIAYTKVTEAARSIKRAYDQDDSNLEALVPFIEIINENIDTVAAEQSQKEKTWAEIVTIIDQRQKVVGTEARRRKQILAYMTPEQGMRLTQALWSSVEKHVKDKAALYNIAEDFKKMLGS